MIIYSYNRKGREEIYSNLYKHMTLTVTNIKGALVSTVLMAVLAGAGYVVGLGDVFLVESKTLINIVVIALLTGVVSLVKNLLTNKEGVFVGVVEVK